MADQEQSDKFAAEMARRFEEFTQWAIEHWPNREMPLLESDFESSRKEMQQILGAKLSQALQAEVGPPAGETVQYVNMNPAPWP